MKNQPARPTAPAALRLGSIALALALLHAPASALDYVWQGGNGFWDDPARWTLLGVPGSGDSATLPRNTGTGALVVRDARSVGQLFIDGGTLTASSTLTVGELSFGWGSFGHSFTEGAGGVMNVTGKAVFNGAEIQGIDYSHTINLGGNATWTAGNGRLIAATAYSKGNQSFAAAALNIGAGTTFTDEGAASAAGFKVIAGTNVQGSYLRTGVGETLARNVHITGTLDVASGNFSFDTGNYSNSSSGLIKVASGSTLALANVALTGGSLVNNGLVRQIGGEVTVSAAAQIGGAWQLDLGALNVSGTHAISSLAINAGQLTGPGTLTTGSLVFNYGKLGGTGGAGGGGTLNVTGPATFNGQNLLVLDYNHTVNLQGDSRWTAGNGRLALTSVSSAGPGARVVVGTGTTFTDEGAATAGGYKWLAGSGGFINEGRYLRTGLGETWATGFTNTGTLQVAEGMFSVDENFSNTGRVDIAGGARLQSYRSLFVNDGVIAGTGTVGTFSEQHALTNRGTLDPGEGALAGTLLIQGDLTLTGSSVLHIDLTGLSADRLVVSSDALLGGELSLWGGAGFAPLLGDVYTIASYGRRLSGSSFDSVSWHGLGGTQFAVEYTATDVLLRVTAVPEPATCALWALGLALIGGNKLRRRRAQA